MESSATRNQQEDLVYIDLDEPRRWWTTLFGMIAVVVILAVLIGPWMIDLDGSEQENLANNTLQNSGSVCRPDSNGVPSFLDPTVASWSRFCEWFITPGGNGQE